MSGIYTRYKYRSLENFKWFVDILAHQRLRAAKYTDLNDPMEGIYFYKEEKLDQHTLNKITSDKEKLRICSLSDRADSLLMWSHYANGHQGICIEVEVSLDDYDIRQVNYGGHLHVAPHNINGGEAKDILGHKFSPWAYEKEWRAFTNGNDFIKVIVKRIFLGNKMGDEDKELVRMTAQAFKPDITVEDAPENLT